MKILVAEDEAVTRRKLEFMLSKWEWEVISASNGRDALEIMKGEEAPSLAIIDIIMPQLNGIEVCSQIRQIPTTVPPYLILLTVKNTKEDTVIGLEAGANDYITKPFDFDELRARLSVGRQMWTLQRNLADKVKELEETLSRTRHLQGLLRTDKHVYEFGPFRLEAAERRLLKGNQIVPLTGKVFDLLLLLVQNKGHLIEKAEIMQELWPHSIVEENNLTVNMSALRKALGGLPGEDEYIETVPKRGYRFVENVRTLKEALEKQST